MMVNHKVSSLLLIAFDRGLAQHCIEELSPLCDLDYCYSMDDLETLTINPGAVIYVMDFTSSNHLYNINFIRNRYPDKQFFVISSTVSIPLLHQSLHIGVNDLFIHPLSVQDKHDLFYTLKNKTYVKCFSEEIENNNDLFPQMNTEHTIGSLLDIIERDYSKSPSLQDLSNEVHLSPSRICHMFKDICGITYSCYLLSRKIEEGERLLTVGKKSITNISYQIGFANPSHFCRTFKEHFNITPTAYVKGNRDVEHSITYLRYQRLRSELFPDLAIEAQENILNFVEKYHAS